jgi:hypothetical protein
MSAARLFASSAKLHDALACTHPPLINSIPISLRRFREYSMFPVEPCCAGLGQSSYKQDLRPLDSEISGCAKNNEGIRLSFARGPIFQLNRKLWRRHSLLAKSSFALQAIIGAFH